MPNTQQQQVINALIEAGGLAIITRPFAKGSYKATIELVNGDIQTTWRLTLDQARSWCNKRGATQIIIGQ